MGRIGKAPCSPPWTVVFEKVFNKFGENICNITRHIEEKENTNLIAAAPEMLEALEIAQHWGYGQTPSVEEEEKVQNAIKKARGL